MSILIGLEATTFPSLWTRFYKRMQRALRTSHWRWTVNSSKDNFGMDSSLKLVPLMVNFSKE